MTPPAAEADAIDLVRRRVINVVGHELRTPITTVRGLVELLVASPDDDEARETVLPALLRNARRAEQLLDDLLIASEVTTAHPVDAATDLALDDVVAACVEGTAVRVDGTAPHPVRAHRDLVSRALGHLVSNADRYHDGEPSVRYEADDEYVTIVVVTPVEGEVRNLDLGFEVFFRGEDAVTRSAGIGVGLPVARALARVDGGDVEIEQVGHEVVARLRLPRATT